jgi:predicted nuclease of predicted toxin-antitoxin system
MYFLIDASLPRSAAPVVHACGHQVTDVRDISLGSAEDESIARHAQSHHLAILTRDFDFADVRNYPPSQYDGIAVVDLPNETPATFVVEVIRRFVQNRTWIEHLPGRLAIISASRVRFRPR